MEIAIAILCGTMIGGIVMWLFIRAAIKNVIGRSLGL